MLAEWVKIVVFAALSLAPILVLGGGAVEPYGSEHPAFPTLTELASGEQGALDRLGDALLKRSAATKRTIMLRNRISADVLQFVDTAEVVSGRDGWLFSKSELRGENCYRERELDEVAARLQLLEQLAQSAGSELTIALAPDKSALYPELLPAAAHGYWACRVHDTRALRSALAARVPQLVDHLQPLLREKRLHPERQLYFRGDTHWTPYGAALALRQVLAAVFPRSAGGSPPPRLTGHTARKQTDLRNGQLLLPPEEPYVLLDASVERGLANLNDDDAPGRSTLRLVDSFYRPLLPFLAMLFPKGDSYHIDAQDYEAAAADAERVIVESVERKLVSRVLDGALSSDSPLARGLTARNQQRAQACSSFSAATEPLRRVDLAPAQGGFVPSGPDPSLVMRVPAGAARRSICLRASVDAPVATTLEVFLPGSAPGGNVFEAGRSIQLPVPAGRHSASVVLPDFTKGSLVRIDPGDAPAQAALRSLEFGELPSTPTP